MDEQQRAMLDQQLKLKRGAAIIEGTQEQFRQDGGYTNLLNKFGTMQDNSTAYVYNQEPIVDDMQLIRLYEGNGLFAKIIDRPSEEAVKHGLDIDYGNEDIAEYVDDRMDELGFEDKFATAEKWARLYGGSIIVMLIDDGRGLEEPVDWNNVRSIEELRVFERAIVQPDYTTLYNFHFLDTLDTDRPFGEPEYYQVFSIYGYFVVHRTRCLVFRNGRLPEQTTNANYRYWGIPEYVKIKRALRECITSHEDGVKLLERSAQAIYKMKNLANMLATADGENKVLQRLQIIDMARSILNSIAIDTDGEDYTFETLQMSGVKDVLDSTCNMLSAVTNIPQTILFGRSPAGMNSTGDSDMENYYNMVENIQKQNMKKNVRTVIDLILRQGVLEGKVPEEPKYKVKFAALWSLSETEQADVDNKKASTEYTKAQTAQIYMDSNVIDPSEVRKSLASEGSMEIEELLNDEELDIPNNTFDFGINDTITISGIDTETDEESDIISIEVDKEMDADKVAEDNGRMIHILTKDLKESEESIQDRINQEWKNQSDADTDYPASAVIVIKDGKILCASRRNSEGICGPGGHVEDGESPEEAAVREAMEEFNIVPLKLIPLGEYKGSTGLYLPSKIYFTDTFSGTPEADGEEMLDAQWLSLEDLQKEKLFPPFKESLRMLVSLLTKQTSDIINTDGGPGSGNWGHSGRPGKLGGSGKGGGKQHRTGTKESGFSSEAKKRAEEKKSAKKFSGSGEHGSKNSTHKFETSHDTHVQFIRNHKTILVGGKYYTISEAISSDRDNVKEAVAKEIGKTCGGRNYKKEIQKAKDNGKLDEYIKDNSEKYSEKLSNSHEKLISPERLDTLESKYSRTCDILKDREKECLSKIDAKVITSEEYYKMVDINSRQASGEQIALEHAYMAGRSGGYDFTAENMNKKMYASGEKLSDSEQRFVDMVSDKSTELPTGVSLYRCTGSDFIEKIAGSKMTDADFKEKLQNSVGKVVTNESVTSCAPGAVGYFARSSKVICSIKTSKGSKGYVMTQNTNEGEIILPAGTKTVIKSVSVGTKEYPIWQGDIVQDPVFPTTALCATHAYTSSDENKVYVEMEIVQDD